MQQPAYSNAPPVSYETRSVSGQTRHRRAGSEPYYEDVDPRFAIEEPSEDGYQRDNALPATLTPGGVQTPGALAQTIPGNFPATPGAQQSHSYGFPNRMQAPSMNPDYLHPSYVSTGGGPGTGTNDGHSNESPLEHDNSDSSLPDGARSPGGSERASETSHFTSISERPVNPNWRPGSVSGGSAYGGSTRGDPTPQRRNQDVLLNANPDFSIPGVGVGRPGRGRGGGRGAMAASNMGGGLTPMGRYPTDI